MKKIKWNSGWLFSNVNGAVTKRPVTLPHDAMQTEQRLPHLKNGESSGYFPGGRYTYEKIFNVEDTSGTWLLEFEGVYQKSRVYLNGEEVGGHIYGYTDFLVDLSGKLKEGENTVTVNVDNTQTPNSRWYSGSGIYRDVWLHHAKGPYIRPYGVKVTTKSIDPAILSVSVDAADAEGLQIVTEVSYQGTSVAQMTGAEGELTIPDAKLWSAETPALYDVHVCLMQGNTTVDETAERVGIRSLSWSHDKGFQVNGQTVKFRGGCVHHDHGPLGACSFYASEVRRAQKLKEAGFNAVRYAHNPANAHFLNACDEVGLYVMDESFDMWEYRKSDYDYGMHFADEWEGDLSAMIRVAYNHPCVVMYSIGNEILEVGMPIGREYSRKLTDVCHRLDPSRAVINAFSAGMIPLTPKGITVNKTKVSKDDTVDPYREEADTAASGSKLVNMLITIGPAMMKLIGRPKQVDKLAKESFDAVDIMGFNYGMDHYDYQQQHHPDCILCGSETHSTQLAVHWPYVESHDNMIGEFLWTAWDYLGEAGIGLPRYEGGPKGFSYPYPSISGACGCLDLLGDMTGQGEQVARIWRQNEKPYIGVRPMDQVGKKVKYSMWNNIDTTASWTWPGWEGKNAEIIICAEGSEAELLQDGKSLGRIRLDGCKAVFKTVYHPGVLEAKVFDGHGRLIASSRLATAGTETLLQAEIQKDTLSADASDVAYLELSLTDARGMLKASDDRPVTVLVSGAGSLAALGSANPLTTEAYTADHFTTYGGRLTAVLRGNGQTGKVQVKVSAQGLAEKELTLYAV